MKANFIFDMVRKSTTKNKQIVLQGFCGDEYEEEKQIVVTIEDGGNKKELKHECVFSPIPSVKRLQINDKSKTRMITVMIDLPEEYTKKAVLSICAIDKKSNEKHEMYTCDGTKIKKALSRVNYCVDSVIRENEKIIIRGWALDNEVITYQVIEGSKKGKIVDDVQIEMSIRTDATVYHREYNDGDKIGFIITAKTNKKNVYLKVSTDHTEDIQRLFMVNQESANCSIAKLQRFVVKFVLLLKNKGLKYTIGRVKHRLIYTFGKKEIDYNKWAQDKKPTKKELELQKTTQFKYQPTFSIVVPLYETNKNFLDELIQSVQEQTYEKWQLCFSDGSKDSTRLKNIIKSYSDRDERIEYIAEKQGPLGISDNTNQALTIAKGDYIVLGDHDDLFAPDALYECVKLLNNEKCQVIYTDEDKIDQKGKTYFEPNFKPDFNIDLLRSNNYICHMFVVAKELVECVGTFDNNFDGAQDYDFVLRCVEKADKVSHIPKVLYHWRTHRQSTAASPEAKFYAFEAGKRAIQAHYDRMGLDATIDSIEEYGFYKTTYKIKGQPLVSIVIPNKDHINDLKLCMDSIDKLSDYRNYEFIIVENNSTEDETFEFYKSIENRENVKIVYWDKEFNYSAINNYGVKFANGDYILLLNNDTEIINPDCISQLLGYCQRDDVGIVGARLYFKDGSIQHAGVVIGFGGIAGHAFVTLFEEDNLYMSRTKVACDYSAVTAACLMVKKEIFEAVGGLDENFKVAFNDIDFCMKVRELGKLVVYNANAKLYHYESKSRGHEDTPEKQERFKGEIERFIEKWPEILNNGDTYYNINLALDRADFAVKK